ncbi:UDP-sugar transporter sqv-7 [Galdieria sulphuraria]|uniref:Solute carrier, DMT family n=1 Tax=Galdieria sulphuraria TaxID=130081 RepID=M2Y6H9_GALSU|nr:solute carrier, DMT family [Galdieria sulphuraria]EME31454.1 solute carrier, DMT family [Galdieria sulphuraria]GJD06607.1 UDP-sugar transporter sqv-7 [Galdieria sulphuraria]|eukprot:XP_005707974.1 solute carrier, DMT family [Galdieria sulphuraria]
MRRRAASVLTYLKSAVPKFHSKYGALVAYALKSLIAALYYILVSVSLTVFNKSIFQNYDFQETTILVSSQLSITILLLFILQKMEFISTNGFQWDLFVACLPLALSYYLMLVTSMVGLRDTNLVIYNTLRRTTVFFVLILEKVILGKKASWEVVASVIVMLSGTMVAAIFDMSFSIYGYFMVFSANLTTAVYLVLIRYTRDQTKLDNFGILYYCSLSCLPLFLLTGILDGSLRRLFMHAPRYEFSFWLFFILACSFGFVINHSIYYNTTTNSALTQNISAQVKDLALLVSSYYFFHPQKSSTWGHIGVATSFVGGLLYVLAKVMEMKRTLEELPNK